MNYYNEFDKFPAQWLRNLSDAGHISKGHVDERSITDVKAEDLRGYTQCHFFAGIGVWSYALRLAGWDDDREVWTGSCPCQPFSAAGKRGGTADARHLWPEWFRLIRECKPRTIFGEQVASKDGLAWLDIVCTDLEGEGYTVGAVDICACGVGAPHKRQRLFFVADSMPTGRSERRAESRDRQASGTGTTCIVAESEGIGLQKSRNQSGHTLEPSSTTRIVADTDKQGQQGRGVQPGEESGECAVGANRATNGFWKNAVWLPCRDGKARATQPGIFPLAHGVTGRVGRLRAYGNAIVAPVAAGFIKAYMG